VSLLTYRGSDSKRLPGFSWQGSGPQSIGAVGQANYFYLQEHKALAREFWSLYRPVLEGLNWHRELIFEDQPRDSADPAKCYGGIIAFIQEPGAKLRSVASPYLVHQMALRHFGKSLYRFVRSLPWDCTHDQSKPFERLRESLCRGREISSIDLSSATDHFPLVVQLVAARCLFGNQPDIALFECLSRSTWRSPLGNLRWEKGQPLGLYPSFGLFTLTHGLVLWHLNGCRHDDEFFVVGDDVVILKPELAQAYKDILRQMGVPWSPAKTVTSDQLCEFAGKVITQKGVIPQLKWREVSNDNFLDVCRLLGPRSRALLTSRQRKVFDLVKHCVQPHGLNFSFRGSTYQLMLERTRETFPEGFEHLISSLMGLASVIDRNVYTSEFQPPKA
jgi:hypothetical protein